MEVSNMQEPNVPLEEASMPAIFRFKFNEEIINLINKFAIIHQNDDRKTYKQEWSKWFIENNAVFEEEIIRLTRLGYLGNIEYKMFNAGRYYFRKKELKGKNNDDHLNDGMKKKRKIYTPINHEVINAMDNHIHASILNVDKKLKFKPADGYDDFCKTHINLLKPIIKQMIYNQMELSLSSSSELSNNNDNISLIIISKIKKTYKNRCFIITHNKH